MAWWRACLGTNLLVVLSGATLEPVYEIDTTDWGR